MALFACTLFVASFLCHAESPSDTESEKKKEKQAPRSMVNHCIGLYFSSFFFFFSEKKEHAPPVPRVWKALRQRRKPPQTPGLSPRDCSAHLFPSHVRLFCVPGRLPDRKWYVFCITCHRTYTDTFLQGNCYQRSRDHKHLQATSRS